MGLIGGHMQPQGHLQVVVNLEDYGMNPQAALDAPRWQFLAGQKVALERSVPQALGPGLSDRGHSVQIGQLILRHQGVLLAASDPRADGLAIAR